jgi:hypothetical protein
MVACSCERALLTGSVCRGCEGTCCVDASPGKPRHATATGAYALHITGGSLSPSCATCNMPRSRLHLGRGPVYPGTAATRHWPCREFDAAHALGAGCATHRAQLAAVYTPFSVLVVSCVAQRLMRSRTGDVQDVGKTVCDEPYAVACVHEASPTHPPACALARAAHHSAIHPRRSHSSAAALRRRPR